MNTFDEMLGAYDSFEFDTQDLGLWPFNKIAKAVKKASKKVVAVTKAVSKKAAAFVKSDLGKKIMATAVGVAGTVAAGAIGAKAAGYLNNVIGLTKKAAGEQAASLNNNIVKGVVSKVKANPQFKMAMNNLKAQGVSPEMIKAQWANSQAYNKAATAATYSTTANAIQGALESRGVPPQVAQKEAAEIAAPMAAQAVKTVKDNAKKESGGFDAKAMLPLAAGAAALLLATRA